MGHRCVQHRHSLVPEDPWQVVFLERGCCETRRGSRLNLGHTLVDHQRARQLAAGSSEDGQREGDPDPSAGAALLPALELRHQLGVFSSGGEEPLGRLEGLRGDLAGAHAERAVDDQVDREAWSRERRTTTLLYKPRRDYTQMRRLVSNQWGRQESNLRYVGLKVRCKASVCYTPMPVLGLEPR